MLTATVTDSTAATYAAKDNNNDLGQKDIFLKLLVAQMQYQDPLNPQDASQMSSQLAQFNMVEQQTTSNKLLEKLVANSGNSATITQPSNGASYLGHTVTVNQPDIYYDGSNQSFTAVLNEPATEALVFIMDATGNPVRTMPMNNLVNGDNVISWDGRTDTGADAAQGNYSIHISASNLNGAEVGYQIQRSGQVDAVRFTTTGTEVMVGGIAVPIANITEIRL